MRDSVGIRIIVNDGPTDYVDAVEVTRIGRVDGPEDYLFDDVKSVAIEQTDEVMVVDGGSGTVRFYNGQGRFLRKFGSRGGGPGEADYLRGGAIARDTVFVAGSGSGPERILIFTDRGGFVSSWPRYRDSVGMVNLVGYVGGRWLAEARHFPRRVSVQPGDLLEEVLTLRPVEISNGRLGDPIIQRPGRRLIAATAAEAIAGPLFDPMPTLATSRDFVFYSRGQHYDIQVFDATGALIRRIRRQVSGSPVEPGDVAEYKERVTEFYRPLPDPYGTKEAELSRARDGRDPVVDTFPVLGRLIASHDGWLWAERLDLAGDPVSSELEAALGVASSPTDIIWDVFEPSGRYAYSVPFPLGFRPLAVGPSWSWGVQRDEMDVEYVVRLDHAKRQDG